MLLLPYLLELGVTVTINENLVETSPVPIIESCATISDGENTIPATALVGVDLNQKGMQTSQQFGAASTYGKKYALGNLFLIDDTEDADASNTHGKAAKIASTKTKMTKEQLQKAVEYVAAGGDISAIEAKYEVSAAQSKVIKAKLK